MLNLDITDRGPALAVSLSRVLHFELVCSLAAFMPGPSNMRAARGVSSYKYAFSYEKEVSSGFKI